MKHFYYVTLVGKIGENSIEKDFNTETEARVFATKQRIVIEKILRKEAWNKIGKLSRNW
jgi:hypothetical protein